MGFVLQSWQLVLFIVAGWVNRHQREAIEYLKTENRVLREKLGSGRIMLNDDQRKRLAIKGKVLGRKRLAEIGSLFTPDTILRWHRKLIAMKWDYSDRRQKKQGRPTIDTEIVHLILKFAKENPSWGYDRITGALGNVGHCVSDQTVGNVLKDNGIERRPIANTPLLGLRF